MKRKQINEINMNDTIYFSIFSSFLIKKKVNNDFYKMSLYDNIKYIMHYNTLIYYIKKRCIVEYI